MATASRSPPASMVQSGARTSFRPLVTKSVAEIALSSRFRSQEYQDRNAAGTELPCEMRYVPGKGERSSINLIWRLPDDHLAGFHDLVLAGKMPRQAVVFFQHGELEFGWEPDGSGQKWDNEKTPAVLIENVRFDLSLQVSPVDRAWNEKVPDHYDPAFFSDAAKVNFSLVRKLSAIESSMGRLSWIIGLIALLMLVLVLSRFSH
jgi:hypothetical protein